MFARIGMLVLLTLHFHKSQCAPTSTTAASPPPDETVTSDSPLSAQSNSSDTSQNQTSSSALPAKLPGSSGDIVTKPANTTNPALTVATTKYPVTTKPAYSMKLQKQISIRLNGDHRAPASAARSYNQLVKNPLHRLGSVSIGSDQQNTNNGYNRINQDYSHNNMAYGRPQPGYTHSNPASIDYNAWWQDGTRESNPHTDGTDRRKSASFYEGNFGHKRGKALADHFGKETGDDLSYYVYDNTDDEPNIEFYFDDHGEEEEKAINKNKHHAKSHQNNNYQSKGHSMKPLKIHFHDKLKNLNKKAQSHNGGDEKIPKNSEQNKENHNDEKKQTRLSHAKARYDADSVDYFYSYYNSDGEKVKKIAKQENPKYLGRGVSKDHRYHFYYYDYVDDVGETKHARKRVPCTDDKHTQQGDGERKNKVSLYSMKNDKNTDYDIAVSSKKLYNTHEAHQHGHKEQNAHAGHSGKTLVNKQNTPQFSYNDNVLNRKEHTSKEKRHGPLAKPHTKQKENHDNKQQNSLYDYYYHYQQFDRSNDKNKSPSKEIKISNAPDHAKQHNDKRVNDNGNEMHHYLYNLYDYDSEKNDKTHSMSEKNRPMMRSLTETVLHKNAPNEGLHRNHKVKDVKISGDKLEHYYYNYEKYHNVEQQPPMKTLQAQKNSFGSGFGRGRTAQQSQDNLQVTGPQAPVVLPEVVIRQTIEPPLNSRLGRPEPPAKDLAAAQPNGNPPTPADTATTGEPAVVTSSNPVTNKADAALEVTLAPPEPGAAVIQKYLEIRHEIAANSVPQAIDKSNSNGW